MNRYFISLNYQGTIFFVEIDPFGSFKSIMQAIKVALPVGFNWADINIKNMFLIPSWIEPYILNIHIERFPFMILEDDTQISNFMCDLHKVAMPFYSFRFKKFSAKEFRETMDYIREHLSALEAVTDSDKYFALALALYWENYWKGLPDRYFLDRFSVYEISDQDQIDEFCFSYLENKYGVTSEIPFSYFDTDAIMQDMRIMGQEIELPGYVSFICFE